LNKNNLPSVNEIHTIAFDFDGVFTDNKVWISQDGHESVCCDRSDGLAFDILRIFQRKNNLTIDIFILSKETNSVVAARAKKLKIGFYQGIDNKMIFIENYLNKRFPDQPDVLNGLVYLGNDLNDLQVMQKAGFSIAPSDAHKLILEVASRVFPQRGGDGFIRAFIEELLGINQFTKEQINELIFDC
jgi:N-acylneuraminate cytidylyltransferase